MKAEKNSESPREIPSSPGLSGMGRPFLISSWISYRRDDVLRPAQMRKLKNIASSDMARSHPWVHQWLSNIESRGKWPHFENRGQTSRNGRIQPSYRPMIITDSPFQLTNERYDLHLASVETMPSPYVLPFRRCNLFGSARKHGGGRPWCKFPGSSEEKSELAEVSMRHFL
jgi:hypothetical protein